LTTLRIAHVDLGLELADSLHGSGGNHNHSSSELLPLHATQQSTHVISSLTTIELLVEHLNTSQGGLEVGTKTNNLDIRALGDDTSLNTPSGDSTTTGDGEDIYDEGNQKAGPMTPIGYWYFLPSTGIKNGFSRSPDHTKEY